MNIFFYSTGLLGISYRHEPPPRTVKKIAMEDGITKDEVTTNAHAPKFYVNNITLHSLQK